LVILRSRRRLDLARLDEPEPHDPVVASEFANERFVVTIVSQSHFTLAALPLVHSQDFIEHVLDVSNRRQWHGLVPPDEVVRVRFADDVINSATVAISTPRSRASVM